jgi:coniferyl-aldehyde dehydrogenase
LNEVFEHEAIAGLQIFSIGREPFGGIGPAGMGAYHGHDGFREFSHRKSVFHQMKSDFGLKMLRPPYGAAITRYLASQIKR